MAGYSREFLSIEQALKQVVKDLKSDGVLKSTGKIERILGKGGINVLRRVFGIILLAIAIKLTKLHIAI